MTLVGPIRVKFTSFVGWWRGEKRSPFGPLVNSIAPGTAAGILLPVREARGPNQHTKEGKTKSVTEKWSRNPNQTVHEN